MSDIKKIIGVTVGTNTNPQILRSGKADKVEGATEGNFAALDASGNLTDSGVSTSDISEAFEVLSETSKQLGVVENKLTEKGGVIPLVYKEKHDNPIKLGDAHPANETPNQYAWIDSIHKLVVSRNGAWEIVPASPYDTYVFNNSIYFYKDGRLTEVDYLRDINAVSESVIAALPIYNGEVEENTEVIENLPVTVDFSEGDQTITAPDGYLVKSAILQKPETLVPENIADGVTVLGVTGTHEGGGGVGEGYVTITFMDGDTVLFSRPVYIGDDCPDPVEQDRIEAPTKESTAQYEYTFSGWSTANGGSASNTALKNITADKTVYAAFASEVRYYTLTFYDGTTLLHTEQVAYGESSVYDYDKQGYVFKGWTPEPTNITSDLACYGVWEESSEIGDTWDEIVAAVTDGTYATKYRVGLYKPLDLGDEGIINMQIVGMDLDKLSGGGGATVALTFVAKELFNTKNCINSSNSYDGNFANSPLYTYLNGTIKTMLPTSLQEGIKTVSKRTRRPNASYTATENLDLWIPSAGEIGWTDGVKPTTCEVATSSYVEVYNSDTSRIKYLANDNETPQMWWTRTGAYFANTAIDVYANGVVASQYGSSASKKMGVCLGFCI